MVAQSFSGVLIVMYGDVVNPISSINLMIFVKVLPRDSWDGLDVIPIGKN